MRRRRRRLRRAVRLAAARDARLAAVTESPSRGSFLERRMGGTTGTRGSRARGSNAESLKTGKTTSRCPSGSGAGLSKKTPQIRSEPVAREARGSGPGRVARGARRQESFVEHSEVDLDCHPGALIRGCTGRGLKRVLPMQSFGRTRSGLPAGEPLFAVVRRKEETAALVCVADGYRIGTPCGLKLRISAASPTFLKRVRQSGPAHSRAWAEWNSARRSFRQQAGEPPEGPSPRWSVPPTDSSKEKARVTTESRYEERPASHGVGKSDENGQLKKKVMELDREANLKQLLEALYPGIRVATVDVPRRS